METNQIRILNLPGYEILQTLGKGSYGRVRLIKDLSDNNFYAVKILKKTEIVRRKQVIHLQNELAILKMMKHPFIVNFVMFHQDNYHLYLVLEYVPGGELYSLLRNLGNLEINSVKFYSAQVVSIFESMHSYDIVYRDLKPENVLLNSDGYIKLSDLGFAKIVKGRTYTVCGTPNYMAPEVLLSKGHGKAVDWWTLGIFLYELLTGIDPFYHEDTMGIYVNIIKGDYNFPKNFDKHAKSLIKHLLVHDLTKRYGNLKRGVKDIKNHRFFSSVK